MSIALHKNIAALMLVAMFFAFDCGAGVMKWRHCGVVDGLRGRRFALVGADGRLGGLPPGAKSVQAAWNDLGEIGSFRRAVCQEISDYVVFGVERREEASAASFSAILSCGYFSIRTMGIPYYQDEKGE